MIIELHLLQSFPASNLNRDDVGQPKSVTFGGALRGRISSQCLKRSARQLFTDHGLDPAETGVRTKRLVDNTAQLLGQQEEGAPSAEDIARAGLTALGFGVENTGLTQYLLFVGREASSELAEFCRNNWDELVTAAEQRRKAEQKAQKDPKSKTAAPKVDKAKPSAKRVEQARRILDAGRAADIALFGRMIADNKDFNVDAASQVAHALSTHAVATEFDYYTAVDDLKPDEEAGADMIGTVDFNAACYYRYANLDLAQLATNLSGDEDLVARAANAWLNSFIRATPSGKQNSTAARTLPDTLLAVARGHGAWNLANAFLNPVIGHDLMADSTDRMLRHFQHLRNFYGHDEIRAVAGASVSGEVPHLEAEDVASNVGELTDRVLTAATG